MALVATACEHESDELTVEANVSGVGPATIDLHFVRAAGIAEAPVVDLSDGQTSVEYPTLKEQQETRLWISGLPSSGCSVAWEEDRFGRRGTVSGRFYRSSSSSRDEDNYIRTITLTVDCTDASTRDVVEAQEADGAEEMREPAEDTAAEPEPVPEAEPEPVPDPSGVWAMLVDPDKSGDCGDEPEYPETITISVVEKGALQHQIEVVGIDGSVEDPWTGTFSIETGVLTFDGEKKDGLGSTTAAFQLTYDAAAGTLTGGEEWSYTGPDGVCPDGTSTVSATRA